MLLYHISNTAGWLRTFEEYYRRQTRNILNLMTDALSVDSKRKFIWAEISYLDLWWNEQNEHKKEQFKRFVCMLVCNVNSVTIYAQPKEMLSLLFTS